MKIVWGVLCISILTSSCKPRAYSSVKHEFGATSRVPADYKFGPCTVSYETQNRFPKTVAYVRNIALDIMRRNPQVFKEGSNLSPEKFCFNIVFNPILDAKAYSGTRSIEVSTGTFMAVENDAEFAAIMAHELAHTTLLHNILPHNEIELTADSSGVFAESVQTIKAISEKYNQAHKIRDEVLRSLEQHSANARAVQDEFLSIYGVMLNNLTTQYGSVLMQRYVALRNTFLQQVSPQMRDATAKQMDELAQIVIAIGPMTQKHEKIRNSISTITIKNTNVGFSKSLNWQEQEADEVGYEFYRRAGFRSAEFFNMLKILAMMRGMSGGDMVECMRASFAAIYSNSKQLEPRRGEGSHPEVCWRVFDHQREQVLHQKDYAQFPDNRVVVDPGGFADAIAEIQADPRNRAAQEQAARQRQQ